MTQEKSERLAKYFTGEARPCRKYDKDALCRSVTVQRDQYANTYVLEEIVFSGEASSVTRYDLTEFLNFGGLYTKASIENGELVEVTPSPYRDFNFVEESVSEETDESRRARAKQLFHTFASVMHDQAKGQ